MSEDCWENEVFALLDDEYARAILIATSIQPMSAKNLSKECGASLPTVYRRAERLAECGLIDEGTQLADDGHHYSVYEARLDRLTVKLKEGELQVTIEEKPTEDMADRFTDMWGNIS